VKIHTIWLSDSGNWSEAWLKDAWDEYTIDENPTGWAQALEEAELSSSHMKLITLEIPGDHLAAAWTTPTVEGDVADG